MGRLSSLRRPEPASAPRSPATDSAPLRCRKARQGTLTLVTNRAPSDLDPHSAYDAGSRGLLQGPFEGLIRAKANTTDEFVPVLAESWEANADESVWTFRLRDGVTFQDGTPLDAFAARASFERLFTLGLAPSTVLGRFLEDPAQITAPDRLTLVFDLGRPQPLFEAALASAYGTAIVNVAALQDHEVDGDWGHAWAQTSSEGLGTGPYRIIEFDVETGVVLERYDGYWRGWEGEHFDGSSSASSSSRDAPRLDRKRRRGHRRRLAAGHGARAGADSRPGGRPSLQPDVRYIAMTVAGPLASPEARQALCWAFPYDEVIAGVYEGYAKRAIGPIAELCRGFDPNTFVYETDLERARAPRSGGDHGGDGPLSMLCRPGIRRPRSRPSCSRRTWRISA